MPVATNSWLLDILILTASLLFLLHWYVSSSANFFRDRGIPFLRPMPFVGQLQLFTKTQYDFAKFLYKQFPNERFFGFFQTKIPTLLVKDPHLVQQILVKDFAHFHDRGLPSLEHDKLTKNLLNLNGQPWRVLRQKLIPTFSTGKLKLMFHQLSKCGDNLLEDIQKVSVFRESVDLKMIIFNYSTEVIGSTAFGLDFGKNNPLAVEFVSRVNKMFKLTLRLMLTLFLLFCSPKITELLGISAFSKDTENFYANLTKSIKNYRKQKNIKRDDYFQLLLTLQEAEENGKIIPAAADNSEEDTLINQMEFVPQSSENTIKSKLLSDDGITAQLFVFLLAGTESVSSTLTFALYHIAKDLQVQKKVTEEVNKSLTKHGGFTYQAIKDMTYLDQVIQETQRLYPTVPLMMRECTIPYPISGTNIVLSKGTLAVIPVAALHMDANYYPSPEAFDPDRFVNNDFKPSPIFLPFGNGPRICIAMRFAILQMKVCLAKVFAQYSVEVNSKTKEPFTYDRTSAVLKPVGGIWVDFKDHSQKTT